MHELQQDDRHESVKTESFLHEANNKRLQAGSDPTWKQPIMNHYIATELVANAVY